MRSSFSAPQHPDTLEMSPLLERTEDNSFLQRAKDFFGLFASKKTGYSSDSSLHEIVISEDEEPTPISLLTFPPEIKLQIMNYLEFADIHALSRVNKEMRQFVKSFSWKNNDSGLSLTYDAIAKSFHSNDKKIQAGQYAINNPPSDGMIYPGVGCSVIFGGAGGGAAGYFIASAVSHNEIASFACAVIGATLGSAGSSIIAGLACQTGIRFFQRRMNHQINEANKALESNNELKALIKR